MLVLYTAARWQVCRAALCRVVSCHRIWRGGDLPPHARKTLARYYCLQLKSFSHLSLARCVVKPKHLEHPLPSCTAQIGFNAVAANHCVFACKSSPVMPPSISRIWCRQAGRQSNTGRRTNHSSTVALRTSGRRGDAHRSLVSPLA